MSRVSLRLAVVLSLFLLTAVPALALSGGPPTDNDDGDAVAKVGCTCHNNGAPSGTVLIKVSGVPHAYDVDISYTLTLEMADSGGNTLGGFLMTTEGAGTFSWDAAEMIRPEKDSGEDKTATSTTAGISHSEPVDGATWTFTWTAPSSDLGDVTFWMAGNMVDGAGAPDDQDMWNTLSFVIDSPSETSAAANQSTRVISVGDYSLFEEHDDAAALEQAEQDALSKVVMAGGITWFFTSLVALIIGGVVQKEILERRLDTGPDHLDKQLAYPEGLRRGLLAIGLALLGLHWMASDAGAYLWTTALFCSAWAAYGVYRTILAARTAPTPKDMM